MQVIKVKAGQNLTDIAIRYSGSIESLFDIAVANNLSVIDERNGKNIKAGDTVIIPSVYDKRVVNYFVRNEIEPASK